MSKKKAIFTPTPDNAQDFLGCLLYSGDDSEGPCVSFMVEADTPDEDRILDYDEVSICPITEISGTVGRFMISGERLGVEGVIAKLSVDLTVEPPEAFYSEESKVS
jgi:hypothetical protein